MDFKLINLSDSWFEQLNLDELGLIDKQIPKSDRRHPWKCAVNEENRILFTQLISDSHDMRDGMYWYLLAIDKDLILVSWECGRAGFENIGSLRKYKKDFLVPLINFASTILTIDKKPLF